MGDGDVLVIVGWSYRFAVERVLDRQYYAAIGQLYSPTRGIDLLIRNLLLNPLCRKLVVLNATEEDKNAGGCKCLLDFIEHGFAEGKDDSDRQTWIIESDVLGYIGYDIDRNVLNELRSVLRYAYVQSIENLSMVTEVLSLSKYDINAMDVYDFHVETVVPVIKPGPFNGHRIEANTVAKAWIEILHRIKSTGHIRPTGYGGQVQELINMISIVNAEPLEYDVPDFLPFNRQFLSGYFAQIVEDKPSSTKYSYGQRIFSHYGHDQLKLVVDKLKKESYSASAVITLWDVQDHFHGSSPCLNHIRFHIHDGKLVLTATFRSNDMFSAWPLNAMGLIELQRRAAVQIGVDVGPLTVISQSAHIYDDTWAFVDATIAKHRHWEATYDDPCGNFLIELIDQEIVVTQTTPGSGSIVEEYRGGNAARLIRAIGHHVPFMQASHAMYLGSELQKAEMCLRSGKMYAQDRPLSRDR